MNRDTLKQIMIDQKDIYLNNPLITRQYFLEANVNYCFVGIRRTGKSYMMYQQIKQLEADGIPLSERGNKTAQLARNRRLEPLFPDLPRGQRGAAPAE